MQFSDHLGDLEFKLRSRRPPKATFENRPNVTFSTVFDKFEVFVIDSRYIFSDKIFAHFPKTCSTSKFQ